MIFLLVKWHFYELSYTKTHSEMFKDIYFRNIFKVFYCSSHVSFQKKRTFNVTKLCMKVNGVSWNISTIFSLFKQSHYSSVYHIHESSFIYYHLQEISQRITRCYIILTLKQRHEIKIRNKNDKNKETGFMVFYFYNIHGLYGVLK